MSEREEVIGVAELCRRLRLAAERATGHEWIEGEVADAKRAPSGHVYFSLKDEREDALLDCVQYRLSALRSRVELVRGARVQVWGKATLWAPRGRLQLVVDRVRQAGRGALLEALEQLKQALTAEGLFAPERKRALPSDPRTVGVVTSATGAAIHDIRSVAFRRGGVRVLLAPALVQGEHAPGSILRALDLLEGVRDLDVIIVGRGGGAGEDLMAFNDERVVRRIARSRVPVVSAVGHEVDVTLSDLVADVRASTPSQAAELVVPDQRARAAALGRLRRSLATALRSRVAARQSEVARLRLGLGDPRYLLAERQQLVDEARRSLELALERELVARRASLGGMEQRLAARHPRAVVLALRAQLDPLRVRLTRGVAHRTQLARAELGELGASLHALSPLAVLARGYAIALDGAGRALRRARDAQPGDPLALRLGEGRVLATVTRTEDS